MLSVELFKLNNASGRIALQRCGPLMPAGTNASCGPARLPSQQREVPVCTIIILVFVAPLSKLEHNFFLITCQQGVAGTQPACPQQQVPAVRHCHDAGVCVFCVMLKSRWLPLTCQQGVAAGHPARLPPQQQVAAVHNRHDDRGVDARVEGGFCGVLRRRNHLPAAHSCGLSVLFVVATRMCCGRYALSRFQNCHLEQLPSGMLMAALLVPAHKLLRCHAISLLELACRHLAVNHTRKPALLIWSLPRRWCRQRRCGGSTSPTK